MRHPIRTSTATLLATAMLAAIAPAQLDTQWLSFQKNPAMLAAGTVSSPGDETDLAWDDLDNDGDVDLVVVRKQPYTTAGPRSNLLLVNVGGVLTDRTAALGSASSVAGDLGFLTPTNDPDVVIADVDQDGWPDVCTATSLGDGLPKAVGHPRVYRNLATGGGVWLGLRYEEARFPQLYEYTTGSPTNPRFAGVAAGDVTGDGYPDLYFVDHDSSGSGGAGQPPSTDLNDRLLVNDGFGFFADHSQAAMTPQMLLSSYGTAADMADFNGDGYLDLIKTTGLTPPLYGAISYHHPSIPTAFSEFDPFHVFSAYYVSAGDLNGDGRPDVVFTDDASDRFRINTGVSANGIATWTASKSFKFLFGGDDGFGGNNLITDLDGDGWNDVLIADVSVDIPSCSRRTHVYHNLGGTVGTTNVTLREERQMAGNSGWIGVVGMTEADLKGTYDLAAFDVDGDGDQDVVLSRCTGTDVWQNNSVHCNVDTTAGLGCTGTGGFVPTLDLIGPACAGNTVALAIDKGLGGSTALVMLGAQPAALPMNGGCFLNVAPFPAVFISIPLGGLGPGQGTAVLPAVVPPGLSGIGLAAHVQTFVAEPTLPHGFSSSKRLTIAFP